LIPEVEVSQTKIIVNAAKISAFPVQPVGITPFAPRAATEPKEVVLIGLCPLASCLALHIAGEIFPQH